MKKLLAFILLMALSVPAWSAVQWRNGTAENVLDGTSAANLIGYNTYNKVVQPLDNLLSGYCTEYLAYNSSTIITVKAGACVVTGGSVRMFMLDPSDTNLTTANLDTGASFTPSTTYYVYASSPNSTTQTSTYYISLSSTAPTGVTYYKRIGSFYSNASSYITAISNDNNIYSASVGDYSSKSWSVNYQALTDGDIVASCFMNGGGTAYGYTDSKTVPDTQVAKCSIDNSSNNTCTMTFPVRKANYWRTTCSDSAVSLYFVSRGN